MNKNVGIKSMVVFLLLCVLGAAANADAPGERITLKSEVLQEERAIQVLLPEGYWIDKDTSYPVVYLLDGDYNFHGVSGMLDLLANKGQMIPEVILVGIADKGTLRYRENMTPANGDGKGGNAGQFLNFLEKELKPYIDRHYRSAPNATLVGQSIGGLFTINALLQKPDSFDHYVAISPALWVGDHQLEKTAAELVGKNSYRGKTLHLSLADETRMGVYGFLEVLDRKEVQGIEWQFTRYGDENHNSVGLPALRDSLKEIFEGWYLSGSEISAMEPDGVLAHYRARMDAFGINQPIPTSSVKSVIRALYNRERAGEIDALVARVRRDLPMSERDFIIMQAAYAGHFDSPKRALEILRESESRFSASAKYLQEIAGVYEQLDNRRKAREYYGRAAALAERQNAGQWQMNILNAALVRTEA
ncbi:alpha/beta hydrolase [Microbulbifer rhizosphaerae]|uniref:Esterase n=1 Tax=Microbulbifer rhizosphaerae TaxID=1562603 RepID=A0A7W4WEB3_9GAMM|nr:alpha/beta hydrolase-fold protein [Microbulbifer rhizosphaerae]MBB3062670.1 hypothetical protein [Microbulbifer rhizosphaerae]